MKGVLFALVISGGLGWNPGARIGDCPRGQLVLGSKVPGWLGPDSCDTPGCTLSVPLVLFVRTGAKAPAGVEWTLQYPAADVAAIAAAPGPAAIAANKQLSCKTSPGQYVCIAAGPDAHELGGGMIALFTVTLAPTVSSTTIRLTDTLGTTPDAHGYSVAP